jgi:hypothetical protein
LPKELVRLVAVRQPPAFVGRVHIHRDRDSPRPRFTATARKLIAEFAEDLTLAFRPDKIHRHGGVADPTDCA